MVDESITDVKGSRELVIGAEARRKSATDDYTMKVKNLNKIIKLHNLKTKDPDLLNILGCYIPCELLQRSRAHNLQNAHSESEHLLDPPPLLNRHQRIEPDLRQRPANFNLFIPFEH